MKGYTLITLGFALIFLGCLAQPNSKKEIFVKDFGWKVTIPENFDSVSSAQSEKMQKRGLDAVEKTYGEKVDNLATTIFYFKNGQFNYFEANYQPYDTATDGSYLESFNAVNEMIYQTFKTQMAGVKVDTATSVETIDNLEFRTLKMKATYPNKVILNIFMFSRLFGKKEFTVNIVYTDEPKGKLMLKAWKDSKFLKY